MTIHKYQLDLAERQLVPMPRGALILSLQLQNGKPCLWALVDETQPLSPAEVYTYVTGHPVDQTTGYAGTYQISGFVWHVFVKTP